MLDFNQMDERCIFTWTTMVSGLAFHGHCKEALTLFDRMRSEGVKPDDVIFFPVLSACTQEGLASWKKQFIESIHSEPNTVILATLLSCCKIYGKVELLEFAIKMVRAQNPNYLKLAANLNASTGWQDVLNFHAAMQEQEFGHVPGCSSIQVGSGIREFLPRDLQQERRDKIYAVLDYLSRNMREKA
ncbi:LOW QUALITY PROTEIN: Pentatricopeptide repeat, partial [Dillenia turbinata]